MLSMSADRSAAAGPPSAVYWVLWCADVEFLREPVEYIVYPPLLFILRGTMPRGETACFNEGVLVNFGLVKRGSTAVPLFFAG